MARLLTRRAGACKGSEHELVHLVDLVQAILAEDHEQVAAAVQVRNQYPATVLPPVEVPVSAR
jgi:hypothetical protein